MAQARRIIPCLDVQAGRVVKGVRFVNLRDAGDPVEVAASYDREGADEISFLDIAATHEARSIMLRTVQATAERIFVPLMVGGGVRTLEDIATLLRAGADKVGINSAAVANPELIGAAAARFGAQCIVVAIDARRVAPQGGDGGAGLEAGEAEDAPPRWEVFTHGGRRPTGLSAVDWARRMVELGAGELLLTSMDRDGTGEGFDLQLTAAVSSAVPVPVIASGGVGALHHLSEGVLQGGADAVLAASIFHFGTYRIAAAKRFMAEQGIPMRTEDPWPATSPKPQDS